MNDHFFIPSWLIHRPEPNRTDQNHSPIFFFEKELRKELSKHLPRSSSMGQAAGRVP